jgi:hypothetical protein
MTYDTVSFGSRVSGFPAAVQAILLGNYLNDGTWYGFKGQLQFSSNMIFCGSENGLLQYSLYNFNDFTPHVAWEQLGGLVTGPNTTVTTSPPGVKLYSLC